MNSVLKYILLFCTTLPYPILAPYTTQYTTLPYTTLYYTTLYDTAWDPVAPVAQLVTSKPFGT